MQSKAATVAEYLEELPPERRQVVSSMRDLVCRHLPAGYEETMNWGMITWEIPLARYPDTYNRKPLCYASLAAQKNNYALYLMGAYQDGAVGRSLREAFERAGRKLDMGKSCIRFRKLDDLALDAIGDAVAALTPDDFIALYEEMRAR